MPIRSEHLSPLPLAIQPQQVGQDELIDRLRSAASGWSPDRGWPAPVSVQTAAHSSDQPP